MFGHFPELSTGSKIECKIAKGDYEEADKELKILKMFSNWFI